MTEVAEAVAEQEVKPKKTRGSKVGGGTAAPAAEGGEKKERKVRAKTESNLPKREPVNVDKIVGDITDASVITWLVTENPRAQRGATFNRFAGYFGTTTVAEYKERGGHMGDLRWDLRHKYLSIEGVTLVAPEPKAEAPVAVEGQEVVTEPPTTE